MNELREGENGPRIRAEPEDFVVDELPAYAPSGEGGHTFVRVEKRLRTTDEVARDLARAAGAAARDVGFAGRKDRVAVARQWFSVPGLAPEDALRLALPGARVLEAARHPHKLRTGHLRGNRFSLQVRGVDAALARRAEAASERLLATGMPNRFGVQRFGRDGDNAARGSALLRGERLRVDRRTARLLVSALQAAVFNEVLRSRPVPLERVEVGDVARICESGGLFVVEDVERENARAARFELSATGPIFGRRVTSPTGRVAAREEKVLALLGIPPPDELRPPPGIRLRGARRPLRVRPEGLELERRSELVSLRFSLPSGSFATVLVEELFAMGPTMGGPTIGPAPDDIGSAQAVS